MNREAIFTKHGDPCLTKSNSEYQMTKCERFCRKTLTKSRSAYELGQTSANSVSTQGNMRQSNHVLTTPRKLFCEEPTLRLADKSSFLIKVIGLSNLLFSSCPHYNARGKWVLRGTSCNHSTCLSVVREARNMAIGDPSTHQHIWTEEPIVSGRTSHFAAAADTKSKQTIYSQKSNVAWATSCNN